MIATSFRTVSALLFLGAITVVNAQSNVPTCYAYTCAPFDLADFALGPAPAYDSDANGVLFCSYPDPTQTTPPPTPQDYFCTYDDTTGALIDNQDGACPDAVPVQIACARKRELDNAALARRTPAMPRAASLVKKTNVMKNGRSGRRASVALGGK